MKPPSLTPLSKHPRPPRVNRRLATGYCAVSIQENDPTMERSHRRAMQLHHAGWNALLGHRARWWML